MSEEEGGFLVRLNRWRDRWRDPSLTALLVVQCVTVFGLIPSAASGLPVPPALAVSFLLLFMSLVITMARGRWTLMFGAGTVLLASVMAVAERVDPGLASPVAADLLATASFVALSFVVARAVFGPGRFTSHRIRGGVVFYLNIGLLFGLLHRLVAELIPDAYAGLPPPESGAAFRAALQYFSLSTLTSLGLGDLTPHHPLARSLTTLEAVIGQLYPPTLLARIVMLELATRTE